MAVHCSESASLLTLNSEVSLLTSHDEVLFFSPPNTFSAILTETFYISGLTGLQSKQCFPVFSREMNRQFFFLMNTRIDKYNVFQYFPVR